MSNPMIEPIAPMAKGPARYSPIALPFVLTMPMTLVVAGISTATAIGFTSNLLATSLHAWPMSRALALPVMVMPATKRIVAYFSEVPPR